MALRNLFLPRTQRSRTGLTYAAPMALKLKNDALAALGLGRAKARPYNGSPQRAGYTYEGPSVARSPNAACWPHAKNGL